MLNELLTSPGVAVAVFGPDLLLKKANRAFAKLFRFPGIPYGIPAHELTNSRDRDDFHAAIQGILFNRPWTFRAFGFQCADGSSFLQNCNVLWSGESSEQIEIALVWKTAVISAEARLDHFQSGILSQIQDSVCVTDRTGKIIYWNHGAEALYGIPVSFALGKQHDILPISRILEDGLRQIQEDQTARLSGEWETGVNKWISYEITGWFAENGTFEGLICISKDVSIRKSLESEIRASESFYRAMYENSPIPMLIYDVESLRILEANPAACRFYEYQPSQIKKRSIYDLRPESEKQRLSDTLPEIRDSQKSGELQARTWIHETRSGKLLHVEVLSHAVEYQGFNARLMVVRDLSRERLQSKQLKDSENRLKLLFDQTEDMIVTFDLSLRVVTFNRKVDETLHLTEGTRMRAGSTFTEFLRAEDAAFWTEILQRARAGEHVHFEHKHTGPQGQTLFINVNARPLYEDGRISGMAVFVKDITEDRRKEYLLAVTAQLARIGAWEFNLTTNRLSWSDLVYDIHEIPRNEPVNVESAISYYDEASRLVIREAFEKLVKDGLRFDLVLKLITRNGRELYVRSMGEAEWSDGKPVVLKGTFQDITKEELRRQELNRVSERLETATTAARIGIWEYIIGNDFSTWSRTNFELHGLVPSTDMTIPNSWYESLPDDARMAILKAYEIALSENKDLELTFKLERDGVLRHFHTFGKLFLDATGKVERIVGITQDITDSVASRLVLENSLLEKETLLSEVHHRVKNNFSVITSLLGLHINSSADPLLKSILSESRKRILSMALVHEKLYQNKSFSAISIESYLNELIPLIKTGFEKARDAVTFVIDAKNVQMDIVQAVPFGLLVNELVSNSLKHAFNNQLFGTISLELKELDGKLVFTYSDDGSGFDLRSRTGGSATLGIVLINLLIRQLNGKMEQRAATKGFSIQLEIDKRV